MNNRLMQENDEEEKHIRQAIAGDQHAFAELVNTHQRFLYNLALRAVSNPQDAQDITQETFIRAWRAIKTFRGEAGFRTWLYRIMMNLCYDRYPRLNRERDQLSIENEDLEIPQESRLAQKSEQRELFTLIQQHLQALSENHRLVLSLRFQHELSYEEIATVMSIPVGTVKTTIFRAKEKLKERLRSEKEMEAWIH
jgi:RNA polymerase sigma-70 factor (ECF subfamily)